MTEPDAVKVFKKASFLVKFAQTLAIIKSTSIEICKSLTEWVALLQHKSASISTPSRVRRGRRQHRGTSSSISHRITMGYCLTPGLDHSNADGICDNILGVDKNGLYEMTPFTTGLVKEDLSSILDYFIQMGTPALSTYQNSQRHEVPKPAWK